MSRNLAPYLYIWNDPSSGSLVASGLHFRDFAPALDNGRGVVLLKHASIKARKNQISGYAYVDAAGISQLATEDIYSWGDFYWADCTLVDLPEIPLEDLSSLSHFSVAASPLHSARIKSLENNLLVAAHDDGWYVRIFYVSWDPIRRIVLSRVPTMTEDEMGILESGAAGLWVQNGIISVEEKTFNVDVVINRQLRNQ